MKQIFFPLILSLLLFSGVQLIAQTPWYIGGNAIGGPSTIGSTTAQPVVFISSGSERGRLFASGNWAFGTSAGADRVQINSTGTANPLRVSFGGATKLLVGTGGGVSIGSGATPPANGLYVASNIGIATATPAFALDARGTSVFGQFKASGGYAGVILDKSAANQNSYAIIRTAGSDRWTVGTVGSDNFNIRNWTGSGDALTMDINNNNVGIPAIASNTKLNVVGSTSVGTGINTSGYSYGLTANATATYGYGVYASSPYLGVYGSAGSGSYGTFGYSNYIGAYGSGATYGVYGYSYGGTAGTYGYGYNGAGAQGFSTNSYGGNFESTNYWGLVSRTTNGTYAGVFYGAVWTSVGYNTSDKNLKKDIREFDDAMGIIKKLKPQDYLFKDDAKYASLNLPKGRHYGLLAQDVEQVLPNLVSEAPHELSIKSQTKAAIKPTADGQPQPIPAEAKETRETMNIKAVNYIELIPIIVKAMQEQDTKMQNQDVEITNLKNEINELKSLIAKNANSTSATALAGYLKQNSPNPPNGSTMIKYFAPSDSRNAQIVVTDMKGSILKTFKVSNGEGQITIGTGELSAGTYNYTLYVNNAKVDTKQMIIVR